MPTASDLELYPITDFHMPVSVRYVMHTPFGWTTSVFTFDIYDLDSDLSKLGACLWAAWNAVVAPATTVRTTLWYLEFVNWHTSPLAQLYVGLPQVGRFVERVGARDEQGVIILHDEKHDELSGRRFFTPGMPAAWAADGMLTDAGWDGLMNLINGWAMGLMGYFVGGSFSLFNVHVGVIDPSLSNPAGAGLRLVHSLRACQYVDKAPDLTVGLWP